MHHYNDRHRVIGGWHNLVSELRWLNASNRTARAERDLLVLPGWTLTLLLVQRWLKTPELPTIVLVARAWSSTEGGSRTSRWHCCGIAAVARALLPL